MKCEKITFRREATSVGKIPRFSGVSREQNVNKSWVNKQLTGMLAFWRLHMESSAVNKQLMKYPNTHTLFYVPPKTAIFPDARLTMTGM